MSAPINTGGPAFPVPGESGVSWTADGMTLRDYFAAKAMQAFIAGIDSSGGVLPVNDARVAERAYEVADAMLKARSK